MLAVRAMVAQAAIAVHGFVELLEDRELVAGVFLADLEFVSFADMRFGKGIAVIAAGGDSDRHGEKSLISINLPQLRGNSSLQRKYGFVINKNCKCSVWAQLCEG